MALESAQELTGGEPGSERSRLSSLAHKLLPRACVLWRWSSDSPRGHSCPRAGENEDSQLHSNG